jgi:ATP-binding cassette subfamily B protein
MFVTFFLVLQWAMQRLQMHMVDKLDAAIMADLYKSGFDYLLGHSYHFFSNQFAGTLTRRVGKFSQAFEALHDAVMLQFFPSALFVTGAVVILYIRNHVLGSMLFVWVVIFVALQLIVARWRQPLRIARAEEDSRMTGALADAIGNQNTIMLFAARRFELNRFAEVVADWKRATLRSWVSDEIIWGIFGILMTGINIALLYGALVYWREGLVTVGDFALIQAYLLTTFDRLNAINRDLRRFYDGVADATEMIDILETPHEIADAKGAPPLAVADRSIEFKDVSFQFVENRPLLKDFNLSIAGGEKVALVGPSGAGKSTITRLILRFYDVTGGSIKIDGQDIRNVTQDSLRNAIAFVPQEPILFHRTLMENIRYGRRDATDAEVIEAAKQAHCYDFIMNTPEGFNTYVGERGIKLSGGERQRIAIARAILKDAPILILDEATSSLDSESEALIQDALARLMEGKTVIAIAHRLSTVMKMDRIIVIEDGKVAMTGTHQELVAHDGGLYKKLWEIQAGGFIQDDVGAEA